MPGFRDDLVPLAAILAAATLGARLHDGGRSGPPAPAASPPARAPAPPTAAAPPPPARVSRQDPTAERAAFLATSLGEGWSVEGDYAGLLERRAGGLVLRLDRAALRFRPDAEAAAEVLRSVHLDLAEETSSGWRLVRAGTPVDLRHRVLPAGGLTADGLTLRLDGVSAEDLEGRFLVITHELDVLTDEGVHPAWTYARAAPGTLLRLLGWTGDGC